MAGFQVRMSKLGQWVARTPVQTFVLCPIAVVAVDIALHAGRVEIVGWGVPLLIWGYLQYLIVGHYRLPRAGGSAGMQTLPDGIVTTGPYRFTRNPMYLGHLIFMLGLAVTLWSLFALAILIARAVWFHRRVLMDEQRLEAQFGSAYAAYRQRVKRWIPGVI
jgi:protein-S-isoprenylcysteine O-methyltransferase Ste14